MSISLAHLFNSENNFGHIHTDFIFLSGDLIPHDLSGDDLGILTARPCNPQFAIESSRLMSFSDWPTNLAQTPDQLSSAGFFYIGEFSFK